MSFSTLFTSASNIARIQALRPDLAAASIDTDQEILNWYQTFGKDELVGGEYASAINGISESFLLGLRPDVEAAVQAGGFTSATEWYLNASNDGLAAAVAPNSSFDATSYLSGFSDLAAAGIDTAAEALQHFINFGASEGREADGSGVDTTLGGTISSDTTGGGDSGTPGDTLTLTTSVDSLTGTANDDTFVGLQTGNADETYGAADIIDGGAGTDTLTLTNTEGAAANAAIVSNIETLNYRSTTGGGDLDMDEFSGLTTLNLNRTVGANDVSNVALTTAVAFADSNSDMDTTVTYKASAVTGSSDSASVVFNGIEAGADIELAEDVETINLSTTGAASSLADLVFDAQTTALNITADEALTVATTWTGAGIATLTVTGDSLVTLTPALAAATTTIDASGNTAGLVATAANVADDGTSAADLTFTGGAGADDIDLDATDNSDEVSISTAAGDDKVTLGNVALGSNDTVDGGEGTDTLELSDEDALTSTTAARMSGFEVLGLFDANDAGADTYDLSLLSGVTAITIAATSAGDGVTLNNVNATQAGALTVTGTQAVDLTVNVTDASNPGTDDTVSLTVDDGQTAVNTITLADLSLAGVENVNVTATDNLTFTAGTGLTSIDSLTFTGAGDVSLTTGALALGGNVGIDASSLTGDLTLDASSSTTNGAAVTGGTGADNIGMGTAVLADVLNGGGGNDSIDGGRGVDTITLGDGADVLELTLATGEALDTNRKVVKDFTASEDFIDFTGTAFSAVGSGDNDSLVDGADADEYQDISAAGNVTVGGEVSFIELAFEFSAGVDLDDVTSANSLNGTNLLAALGASTGTTAGTITTQGNDEDVVLVAYQDGDMLMYHGNGGGTDTNLVAAEIELIGIYENVGVGDFTIDNIIA